MAWIDGTGHEQLRVSRLAMDAVSSGIDLSQEAKYREAASGRTYYGPVYFRKGTEPYMTIARPAGSGGGVTAAEVNLKFVWDVVSRIKIGESGLAYVVDATGTLIAHPDISLVLKKSDLRSLPQVAALAQLGRRARDRSNPGRRGGLLRARRDPDPALDGVRRVAARRGAGAALCNGAAHRPAARRGAPALDGGQLLPRPRPGPAAARAAGRRGADRRRRPGSTHRGSHRRRARGLAEQFNHMGEQLRESYAGLERKVEQRTAELTEALE